MQSIIKLVSEYLNELRTNNEVSKDTENVYYSFYYC